MDDKIRLALELLGQQGVQEIRTQLDALKGEMGDVAAAFGRGEISAAEFDAETKRVAASSRNLESALDQLSGKKGGGGAAGAGQSFLQLGRITQDFTQGGIGGILNNVEGLTAALGLGSGLAGVLTIVGVAAFTAKPYIMDLWKSFSGAEDVRDQVERLTERIKELEDIKVKLAIDTLELDAAKRKLDELKKDQSAFDAAQKHQTAHEAEAGKQVKAALGGSDEEAVTAAIRRGILNRLIATDSVLIESRRKQAEAEANRQAVLNGPWDEGNAHAIASFDAEIKAEQERAAARALQLNQQAERETGHMIRGASEGHGADQAEQRRRLAAWLRATGHAGLAGQVAAATPQAVKTAAEKKAAADAKREATQQARQAEQERKHAEAEAKHQEAEALRHQAVADKANNDRQAAAKAARIRQGSDQARALHDEQRANVARLDQEVKTITADTGAANQERYEAQLATNAGLQASGAPIARTAAQERALQRQGQAYALPNDVLKRRLRGQMAAAYRQAGASEGAANVAAANVAEKGETRLQQQLAAAQGTNQQRLIQVAAQHNQIFANMLNQQQQQGRQIGDLQGAARGLQHAATSRNPTSRLQGRGL